jgi:hypothetical protein
MSMKIAAAVGCLSAARPGRLCVCGCKALSGPVMCNLYNITTNQDAIVACWRLLQSANIFSRAMVSVALMAPLVATRAALRWLDFYMVPSF